MRIQSQSTINQLDSIQRPFNIKQSKGPPSGSRAIDQILIARQQLNQSQQVIPAALSKPLKINLDPVVIKPTASKGSAKPLQVPPNKPLTAPPGASTTGPKSEDTNTDPVNTVPPPLVTDAATAAVPTETSTPPGESSGAPTLQGLNAAWGTSNPLYDLNGDGIVNTGDLLQFINNSNNSTATIGGAPTDKPLQLTQVGAPSLTTAADPAPPSLTVAPPELTTAPQDDPLLTPAQPAPSLEGLMSAWGQSSAQYDLNNDGTVNVGDLLQFINNITASPTSGAGAAGPQQPANAVGKPGIGGVTKLADALIDRLMKAGFGSQPPTNIRELVDTFNLPTDHSQKLFDRLQQRYPNGLGVNVVA